MIYKKTKKSILWGTINSVTINHIMCEFHGDALYIFLTSLVMSILFVGACILHSIK